MAELLHELILESACRTPVAPGLRHAGTELDYAALAHLFAEVAP